MHSLKYFYWFIFILAVIAFSGIIIFGEKYIEERIIKQMAERNNKAIAELYAITIISKHQELISQLPCDGEPCPDKNLLKKDIEKFTKNFPFLKNLEFYFSNGTGLNSGEKANLDKESDKQIKEGYEEAWNGQSRTYFTKNHVMGDKKLNLVTTFEPVISRSGIDSKPRVLGVLEIAYDITPFWPDLLNIKIAAIVVISFVLLIIILIAYFAVHRTEALLAKQYEANVELVAAKASAEEQSRQKSQFLANVSHELRTPLNAIIGFSEIIKDEVMGPVGNQQYKDYATDINTSGVHLLSLINDILDFSKAEAGKLNVDIAVVDVTKIMKNCLRMVAPRAAEVKVKLEDKIPEKHYILKTDAKRLKQVILNILSNSVKFTPAEGRITLYAWHNMTGHKLVIEIQDTGVGIAPKDISKVMAVFGQVENKLSRKYEGTGLGLPLSKKLVELMGGSLEIESEVGKGTTVRIILPYKESEIPQGAIIDKGF